MGGGGWSCSDHLSTSESRSGHGQWACQRKAWKLHKWAVGHLHPFYDKAKLYVHIGCSDSCYSFQVWDEIQHENWSSFTEEIICICCRFS